MTQNPFKIFPPTKIQFPPNQFISSSRKQVRKRSRRTLHAPKPRPPGSGRPTFFFFFHRKNIFSPTKCSSSFLAIDTEPEDVFFKKYMAAGLWLYLQHFFLCDHPTPLPPCRTRGGGGGHQVTNFWSQGGKAASECLTKSSNIPLRHCVAAFPEKPEKYWPIS